MGTGRVVLGLGKTACHGGGGSCGFMFAGTTSGVRDVETVPMVGFSGADRDYSREI